MEKAELQTVCIQNELEVNKFLRDLHLTLGAIDRNRSVRNTCNIQEKGQLWKRRKWLGGKA